MARVPPVAVGYNYSLQGPATAEGKERSARNPLRHGLLARTVVLENEDGEEFEEALGALVARFQPADPVELGLVEPNDPPQRKGAQRT